MPIEFNCPFCGAFIRVPDKAKGGKGKCPKCAQRISVPKKSTVKPPAAKAPELPFSLPTAAPAPSTGPAHKVDPGEIVFDEFTGDSESEGNLFTTVSETAPQSGEFGYGSEEESPPATRRRKKKSNADSTMLVILGVIALACVALLGFIVVPILTSAAIKSDLIAATAESLDLPPAAVDKSRIDLPPDELTSLLTKLEHSPATIASASVQIMISANSSGLLVSVSPGNQHSFYRVDPSKSDPVKKYLAQYQASLDDQRFREMSQSLMGFVKDYMKVLTKKGSEKNFATYRDSFAIPSLVKGFGNQLVAHHGRSLYRCIYEDADGGLYFLLPSGLTEFEITGREGASGRILVPVEIKVKVEGKIDQPKKPEAPKTDKTDKKTKKKKEEKPDETEEEEMGGKMDGKK